MLLEVAGSITEPVALDRSTRGVGLGIEPQQHVRTREVRQPDAGAVVGGEVELRGEGAFGEHGPIVARRAPSRNRLRRARYSLIAPPSSAGGASTMPPPSPPVAALAFVASSSMQASSRSMQGCPVVPSTLR